MCLQRQRAAEGQPAAPRKPRQAVKLLQITVPTPDSAAPAVKELMTLQPELRRLEACLKDYLHPGALTAPLSLIQRDQVCPIAACNIAWGACSFCCYCHAFWCFALGGRGALSSPTSAVVEAP